MAMSEKKIYPRIGDTQTVYLKNVITNSNIQVGDYTMYNDFVHDPRDFQENNILYHYPIHANKSGFLVEKASSPSLSYWLLLLCIKKFIMINWIMV